MMTFIPPPVAVEHQVLTMVEIHNVGIITWWNHLLDMEDLDRGRNTTVK
jgi:hypothetical protein